MRSSQRKRLQGLCAVASLVGEDKQRQVDLVKAMLGHLGGNDDEDKRSASSSCEVSNAVLLGLHYRGVNKPVFMEVTLALPI